MLNLKKIAITGGISCGKSTVCDLLEQQGAYRVNSDAIIHQLLSDDPACIKQVIKLLGSEIVTSGHIDREKVASIVFANEEKLKALEKILHPYLLLEIDAIYRSVQKKGSHLFFVVEIPLVQEIGKAADFDVIVAVICDHSLSKKRWISKGFLENSYNNRMRRQWPMAKKAKHAHFTITNNGTYEELEKQVATLIAFLQTN